MSYEPTTEEEGEDMQEWFEQMLEDGEAEEEDDEEEYHGRT